MSISTDLTRLQSAKAAMKTAIQNKGVTVTDGAKLDAFAALIDSIPAGGGDSGFACGFITPADTTASHLEIQHGLGAVPALIFIAAADNTNGVYDKLKPRGQAFFYAIRAGNGTYYARHQCQNDVNYHSSSEIYDHLLTGLAYYIAATDQKIIWANRNSTYGFGQMAAPFFWLAMKEIPT